MKVYQLVVVMVILYSAIHIIYGIRSYILSVPEIEVEHFDEHSLHIDNSKWYGHKYVFVGGLHSADNSLVQKLLSSQGHSSGFNVATTDVTDRSGCDTINRFKDKRCKAPFDEGMWICNQCTDYFLYAAFLRLGGVVMKCRQIFDQNLQHVR